MTEEIKKKFQPLLWFKLDPASMDETGWQIIERLVVLYGLLQPEKDFFDDVLKPIAEGTRENPAHLTYQVTTAYHTKYTYEEYMAHLFSSCTDALHASWAEQRGEHDQAWRHIAAAQYHLGVVEGALRLEPVLESIITGRAKASVKKRDSKYEPLRKRVREVAATGQANGSPFPSRRQAVLAVLKVLPELQKEKGLVLTSDYPFDTIDKWLSDMKFGK